MHKNEFIKGFIKVSTALVALLLILFFSFRNTDIDAETLKERYTDSQSQFISIDGLDVHFKDEGTGFPIVLIHGTSASLHTWDAWTKKLIENYRVIRMDLPAFGLTGANKNNTYDLESYNQFLESFMEKVGISEFVLAGNSLGGSIAWHYASNHQKQVKQLVLVDPGGFPSKKGKPFVFKLAEMPIVNQLLKHITPKSFIRNNLEQVYYDDSKITSELVERYHQMILREGSRDAFIERSKIAFKDETALLKKINIPTLILWGENDIWIPVENGLKFDAKLSNSRLVIMKETGHIPMEERPEESLAHMLDFLNEYQTETSDTQEKESS
ncbi:alpha/beta hydrolase [Flavobacteriaceae bacterium]|nr:alpha/beta hydrolase [Flavobacteriaceae bacterium]